MYYSQTVKFETVILSKLLKQIFFSLHGEFLIFADQRKTIMADNRSE